MMRTYIAAEAAAAGRSAAASAAPTDAASASTSPRSSAFAPLSAAGGHPKEAARAERQERWNAIWACREERLLRAAEAAAAAEPPPRAKHSNRSWAACGGVARNALMLVPFACVL